MQPVTRCFKKCWWKWGGKTRKSARSRKYFKQRANRTQRHRLRQDVRCKGEDAVPHTRNAMATACDII